MPSPNKLSTKGHPIMCHTHSYVDLCPSNAVKLGKLCCMTQWDYFVHGLCFIHLRDSCYPTILLNNGKEQCSSDMSLSVPQILERVYIYMMSWCIIQQPRNANPEKCKSSMLSEYCPDSGFALRLSKLE